jgi:hypothetical protein
MKHSTARMSSRVGPGGRFRKILSVIVEPGYTLLLTYEHGETRSFDFKKAILASGLTDFTAPFSDEDFFRKVTVKDGNLVWPNGFDLHGDDVYHASVSTQ